MNSSKKVLLALLCSATCAMSHDNNTIHPLLTDRAFESWTRKSAVFADIGLDQNAGLTFERLAGSEYPLNPLTRNAGEWLRQGSIDEDLNPDIRCLAHFYNPLPQPGSDHNLTDPVDIGASDSFQWASAGNGIFSGSTSPGGENTESWVKAREYYFQALTSPLKTARDAKFAHLFYSLGKVIHLVQDLSQPDHSRNDAHMINGDETPGPPPPLGLVYPSARWIENYGRDNINEISSWVELSNVTELDWRTGGFARLKDFWDRGIYQGDATALDDDAASVAGKALGLAEFANGNFLGEDSTYFEIVTRQIANDPGRVRHLFPHPALADTNYATFGTGSYPTQASTWEDGATQDPTSSLLRNSIFLRKERAGVKTDRHAVLNYSTLVARKLGIDRASVTINAPSVIEELHRLTLPRAISYSSGVIDYFFRGSINVLSGRDSLGQQVITVTNNSGQTMRGGQFLLFSEDAAKNRALGPVVSAYLETGELWTSASALPTGEAITLRFSMPASMPTNAVLIYKGTIGTTESGAASDPEDADLAIATKALTIYSQYIGYPIAQWDTVTATKSKVGFYEQPGHWSNPPKRYLSKTLSGEMAVADYYDAECTEIGYAYHGGHSAWVYAFSGTASYSLEGVLTKADGTHWISGAFNGFGAKPPEYRYDYKTEEIFNSATEEATDDVVTATSRTITGKGAVAVSSSWWGYMGQRAVGTLTETLSDLYETSALKANTIAALPALDNVWGDSPYSIYNLDVSETTFKVQRGRYRVRFPLAQQAPQNSVYRINWVERFMPKGGTGITSLEIQVPGLGYSSTPTVTISTPGQGGTQATATVTLDERGAVNSVTITNPGAGYTWPPSVTISGSSTIPARIVSRVGTEVKRSYEWSGTIPPGYSQNNPNTWPTVSNGESEEFILNEPETNGEIGVHDLTVSFQVPST